MRVPHPVDYGQQKTGSLGQVSRLACFFEDERQGKAQLTRPGVRLLFLALLARGAQKSLIEFMVDRLHQSSGPVKGVRDKRPVWAIVSGN
jgi:hypothetical protein